METMSAVALFARFNLVLTPEPVLLEIPKSDQNRAVLAS